MQYNSNNTSLLYHFSELVVTRLELSLLGGFQAALDGNPVTAFKSNKARALLAYLAIEADRSHRRETLAGLLWPEWPDREALSNLRYTLASLRRTLGDRALPIPFLSITHDAVRFNRASDTWIDVSEFERRSVDDSARRMTSTGLEDLKAGLALYRGCFLEGFSVGDAAAFEEWIVLRREQIAHRVMSALDRLVAHLEARCEYKEAQAYARQQVALEPWSEEAHRNVMRMLALDGQRSAALHQFQACRRTLREELGVEPAEETVALHEAIRAGTLVEKETRKPENKETSGQIGRGTPVALAACLPVAPSIPFVARADQLARLAADLAAAHAGAGHVVFIAGEAGSGKTTLLAEFVRLSMQTHADWVVAGGNCSATLGVGDPYLPFREILQLLTGDIEAKRAGAALTPAHASRLWAAMPDAVRALAEVGHDLIDTWVPAAGLTLYAEAFGGESGRSAWQTRLSRLLRQAEDRADQGSLLQPADLFEQVTHVLQMLARKHPLLLTLDDLQWADAGSISLLFHIGRRLAGSRILVVAAYRPDTSALAPDADRHPLEQLINEIQRITGDRPIDLDACEGRLFVDALLDVEPNHLDADFRELFFHHTEGHPLFTTELLRGLQERGDLIRDTDGCWREEPALHWDELPARVEAVIAERVGRLPDRCRQLLAAASVEGEEFTAEVLARVLGLSESAVIECLSGDLGDRLHLVNAVSLQRLGARKLSRYRFRHHLFQRYIYDHLDTVRRAHLHEAIGRALELLYAGAPNELDVLSARLAWHFEAAGAVDRAAAYHLRAGNRAVRLAAHEEAIGHLTRGLALLDGLPDSPERVRLKLDLQLAVISPYAFARSLSAPERTRALERAYEISQHPMLAGSPQRGLALAALAFFATWSADPDRARQAGEQFLRMAERNPYAQQLQLAHLVLGAAWIFRGDFAQAHQHLERASTHYDFRSHQPIDLIFGVHVGVINLGWDSFALWQLGYPDRALQSLHRTLAAAQESDHRGTLAFARALAAVMFFMMAGDAEMARHQIEALRSLQAEEPTFGAWINSLAGWDAPAEGQAGADLGQTRQAIDTSGLMGSGIGRAVQSTLLALGYARTGQVAAGLGVLDEALVWIEVSGVRGFEAEVQRLKGELLLLLGQSGGAETSWSTPEATAETCFRRAIAVARQQGARWWELRATVSLYRLLQERTEPQDTSRAEARRLLAELYGAFTEGFDMPDLRAARALLEEAGPS